MKRVNSDRTQHHQTAHPERARVREFLFRYSVLLKGLHAVLEIVTGIAVWAVSPELILRMTALLTRGEVSEDPRDTIANYLRHAASHLSLGGKHFIAVYLLAHGVVKLFVVAELLRNKLWGYPLAIVVFGGFIAYQIYRYTLTGGIGLILLTVFDAIVIVLIWLEYRAVKSHRP
jgi:uncharacterized membrane protein